MKSSQRGSMSEEQQGSLSCLRTQPKATMAESYHDLEMKQTPLPSFEEIESGKIDALSYKLDKLDIKLDKLDEKVAKGFQSLVFGIDEKLNKVENLKVLLRVLYVVNVIVLILVFLLSGAL